jgi:hypothetical protein
MQLNDFITKAPQTELKRFRSTAWLPGLLNDRQMIEVTLEKDYYDSHVKDRLPRHTLVSGIPLSCNYHKLYDAIRGTRQPDTERYTLSVLEKATHLLSLGSVEDIRAAIDVVTQTPNAKQTFSRAEITSASALSIEVEYYEHLFKKHQFNITDNYIGAPWNVRREQVFSIPAAAIGRVNNVFRSAFEKHSDLVSNRRLYTPPLPLLLLDNVRSLDAFALELEKLRERYSSFRKSTLRLEKRFGEAQTYEAYAALYDDVVEAFQSIEEDRSNTRFLSSVWNVVKEGSILKIGMSMLDRLSEFDKARQIRLRLNGLHDILNCAMKVRADSDLISRAFGCSPSDAQLDALDIYSVAVKAAVDEL